MTWLELILCIVLAAIAILHTAWAIGLWVPIRDEARLVHAVVGAQGATRMPGPIPCALVASGLVVVILSIIAGPSVVRTVILIAAGVVLSLRGSLAWIPFWRRMTPVEPFATLDRRVYGPLCLMLGVGILVVAAT
ncbi:MAG: DUF3995 domain-containing protein [Yoonia sp.]|nr:DUF3995 domain-containing protein [Yoonia sp.]